MSETVKAQFMTLTELPIIRKNTRNNFKNKRNYKIIEYNNYNNRYDIKDTDKNKRNNSTKNDLVNKSNKSMKKDFYLTNLKNRNSMNNRDTIQKTIYNIRTEGKQTNLKLNPNFINKLDNSLKLISPLLSLSASSNAFLVKSISKFLSNNTSLIAKFILFKLLTTFTFILIIIIINVLCTNN